ncbi:MAG: hypothetical protein AAF429_12120 [Pseudomonadota bacterium]
MRRLLGHNVILSNAFACLMLTKFGLLIFYDWTTGSDYFGQYALAHGLIAGLVTLAGFQGRMLVLSKIRNGGDIQRLQVIMILAALLSATVCLALNWTLGALLMLALVCTQRGLENLLLARSSFIQVSGQKETAFIQLNRFGILAFCAYAVGLYLSLEVAILAEIAALLLALFWQRSKMTTRDDGPTLSYVALGAIGLSYSLSAGLNAGLNSLLLYFSQTWFSVSDAMLLAQILALQAIIARLLASNSVFFLRDIAMLLERYEYSLALIWAALASVLLSLISLEASIIFLGNAFTALNAINIVLRQHIMATSGAKSLVWLHALEMLGFVILAALFATDIVGIFALFALIRTIRIPVLLYLRRPDLRTVPL